MMRRFVVTASAAAAAALVQTAGAGPAVNFQFRVNADPAPVGVSLVPPSIGLVYAGDGINGNVTDAMAFCWPDITVSHVAIPFCDRFCGSALVPEGFGGGGQAFPNHLFLRRFGPGGSPIDPIDIVLTSTTAEDVHGAFLEPSLALCPVNSGPNRFNPFRLAWWDMWSWQAALHPCNPTSCNHQPVAWWQLHYPNFTSPLPDSGSAAFGAPAFCQGHRPSVAYGPMHDLIAWRDVLDPCRRILAGFDGVYVRPPVPGAVVIRESQPDVDVDRPCAAWSQAGGFTVAWREDDTSAGASSVLVRRITWPGVLGAVTTVAGLGQAAENSAPAVTMFDDGSFAVQYVGFQNGDPPITPLLVQLFDSSEPPNPVGAAIEILPNWDPNLNHTITARGPSAMASGGHVLSSVFEVPNGSGGVLDIYGRAIDPGTAALGPITLIPLDEPQTFANRLGDAHQHTALLRSDGATAVTWWRYLDGHVYCTVRTLPLPAPGVCCRGAICQILDEASCVPPDGYTAGARFVASAAACNAPGVFDAPCCNADYNQSGTVSVQDIFDFLADYFAGSPFCDINQSGAVSVQDIFDFLAAYFDGCSPT